MYLKLKFLAKMSLAVWLLFPGRLGVSENYGNTNETQIVEESDICDTKMCHEVAKAFAESMNQTVDPCDDFYQFSCGNWELNNPTPKYQPTWGATQRFDLLARTRLKRELETESTPEDILPIQHVKKLYKLCMDNETREFEGLQKIEAILRETKGWPMTMSSDTWNNDSLTWQEVDHYYANLIGLHAFFTVDIPDIPSKNIQLQFIDLTLPLRRREFKFERNYTKDGIVVYRSVIRNIAQLFIQQNKANISDEKLERDIDDLLKFEESLYKIPKSAGDTWADDIDWFINFWNLKVKVTSPRGKIDWETILQNLYNITNLPMSNYTIFQINSVEYFSQLAKILDSTDERTIVNYIQWNFLSKVLLYTTERVNEILFENLKNDFGVQEKRPRWLECVYRIETNHAASYLFARKYYPKNSKAAVDEMIRNLKASLKLQVEHSDWLKVEAQKAAIEKLSNLSVLSGYPDWYDNDTALVDYYGNLTIGNSYFESILKLKKLKWIKDIHRWGRSTEQRRWTDNILQTNGIYYNVYSIIMIPAATLQPPLFDGGLPDYVKYGTVGALIAHELGHSLDSNGTSHGADPPKELFDKNVSEILTERVRCFIEEFNKYFEDRPENFDSVNKYNQTRAERTLDENLADFIGVETAFDAYKKVKDRKMVNGELKLPGFDTFTDEQMYFISYAQRWCTARNSAIVTKNFIVHDEHTPNDLRVIVPLSNYLAFARTFNCSINSPMNPVKKCNIWMNQTVTP